MRDGGLAQTEDSAIRTITYLKEEGCEVIERCIPLSVFGNGPEKYRELDNKDREELAAARKHLVDHFGSEEEYLSHCRDKAWNLCPVD